MFETSEAAWFFYGSIFAIVLRFVMDVVLLYIKDRREQLGYGKDNEQQG